MNIAWKGEIVSLLLAVKCELIIIIIIFFVCGWKIWKWKHWSANPRRNSHTAYSINVLSNYSSLISHWPSIFEGRHIDHRSTKVDTSITDLRRSTRRSSIFEGQHIDLRRSIHRSSKVNTSWHRSSIFEGRYIDLRKSPHRSSKVDTDFRRSKAETSHLQFVTEYCPQLRSKSLE